MSAQLAAMWQDMLARSFDPQQWFSFDSADDRHTEVEADDSHGGSGDGEGSGSSDGDTGLMSGRGAVAVIGREADHRPMAGRDTREERRMWVYHAVYEGSCLSHFEVGYYAPDKIWHVESRHEDREHAATRVHWLNGGAR